MRLSIVFIITMFTINTSFASLNQTKRSNQFNPSIGLNALFLYQNSNTDSENDGVKLQEAELQFSSDVDSYFRAEATIGIHEEEEEHAEGETSEEHEHHYKVHPEEVFVETISIPNLTIKAGKFFIDFGKANTFHSHNLPFITKSKVQEMAFGTEGYSDTGLEFSYLSPLPWYSEIKLSTLQADNAELFSEGHHSMAYNMKWKNLWEINDDLTFEWSMSGLKYSSHDHDNNSIENKTNIYGSDITFKWRPTEKGKYSSLLWTTEYINFDKKGSELKKNSGLSSYLKYQLSRRFFIQTRYEVTSLTGFNNPKKIKSKDLLLAFVPSEFSSIRLQYAVSENGTNQDDKKILLQLNISIGAHPAHKY